MRIVLEVESGEVTFTVRPASQASSATGGAVLSQAGTSGALSAGPAALNRRDRSRTGVGLARTAAPGMGAKPGQAAGAAPQLGLSLRARTSSAGRARSPDRGAAAATPVPGRPPGETQPASDAGPAPLRLAKKAQAAPPSDPAGESFNLMGGTGHDAGPAPSRHSARRIIPANGGKSK